MAGQAEAQQQQQEQQQEDGGFDYKAALSQRDKALAARDAQIKELEQQLAGYTETAGELGGQQQEQQVLDEQQQRQQQPAPSGNQDLNQRLDRIDKTLDALGTRIFDTHFSTQDRANDQNFVNWAKEKKLSDIDPNSPTLEEAFMDARAIGNDQLARSILQAYDKEMRASVGKISPDLAKSQRPVTPEMKRHAEELADLETQRRAADKAGDFKKVRALNAQIREKRKR